MPRTFKKLGAYKWTDEEWARVQKLLAAADAKPKTEKPTAEQTEIPSDHYTHYGPARAQ